ncbi:ParB/RepB/Spo0J family partition protein [Sinorhizobium fredii]|uniref:ParB/RepB/Spo0J family partition protein n=1 Tax=Rhizobium fredii TaxID=380 RepID=UPI0035144758
MSKVIAKAAVSATEFSVPLGKLKPSEKNVRRVESEAGLDELAASLEHHGQIQNLTVRVVEKGFFEVVAGARRFAALKRLMKEGRSIKGVKVTKDFPVRVRHVDEDDNDTELSLAENMVRSNMHPADEIAAFKRLHEEENMAPEAIADRFGISHMTVRRRLKLANVSPRILAEFREDKVTLDQMQALALSDDHEAQENAWFEAEYEWARRADNLRQLLTDEKVRGSDRLVKFVGLDAYIAANGTYIRDLFSDEDSVFLTDRVLLHKLAMEKLEAAAAEIDRDGWKWVVPTLETGAQHTFKRIHAKRTEPGDEDAARMSSLAARYDEIEAEIEAVDTDGPEYAALSEEAAKIDAEMDEIQNRYVAFDPLEKSLAGIVLSVGYDGKIEAHEGRVTDEDWAELMRLQSAEPMDGASGTEAKEEAEQEGPAFSFAVIEDLTALRSVALSLAVAERPDVALCAIIHPLASTLFYQSYWGDSAVEISSRFDGPRQSHVDPNNQGAFAALSQLHDEWAEELPADKSALWDWLISQPQSLLMQLLAYVTSRSINAWQQRHERGAKRFHHVEQIATAVSLDMNQWWKPSEAFFNRVPKAIGIAAVQEVGGNEEVCKGMEKDTKADAVTTTLHSLRGTNWLPQPLRLRPVEPTEVDDEEPEQKGAGDIAAE